MRAPVCFAPADGRPTNPIGRRVKRFEDWPKRLSQHITATVGLPFVWGERDCCLWACDGLRAMTGVDPAAPFRGRYASERQAYGALKRFAGGGVAETAAVICAGLGWREVKPRMAQRGDVVLATGAGPDGAARDVLGLIGSNGLPLVMAPTGLTELPLAAVQRAWRVG